MRGLTSRFFHEGTSKKLLRKKEGQWENKDLSCILNPLIFLLKFDWN
jgi:hypothetical protein